jgi:hypothetical protein
MIACAGLGAIDPLEEHMHSRAFGSASLLFLFTSFVVTGCGSSHRFACPGASGELCCGPSAACPLQAIPLLYATTSSNQILGFSISSSGALSALPTTTGPANSRSVGLEFNNLVFADTSNNSVDSFSVGLTNGTLTPIQGSPFSLGTPDGGPVGIAVSPESYLYATEPNGTIVGLTNNSEVGSFGIPLPGSPYPAGVAPAQIAVGETPNVGVLYASDPGDSTGGILAYTFDSSGALTPVNGSPFSTLPDSDPSLVFVGSYGAVGQNVQSQFILVSLTNAGKIAVFTMNADGSLTAVPGSPFLAGNGPATIVEDNQNHVFVLNGTDHTVSAFNLASNGVLTAIGSPVPVGTATAGMALGPSQLFVADTAASEIWSLNIDSSSGALTQAGSPLPVTNPPLQLAFVDPLIPMR